MKTMLATASTPISLDMTTVANDSLLSPLYAILKAAHELPVFTVLYVCIGLNVFTHILSIVLSLFCVGNFGKGLKEKVFNSKLDKYFHKRLSQS